MHELRSGVNAFEAYEADFRIDAERLCRPLFAEERPEERPAKRGRDVLLLAAGFVAQYRVMRCAAAQGARVHVMGSGAAPSLSLSRFCHAYRPFDFGRDLQSAARAIDDYAERNGIDLVLPSDAPTTRFLASVRPLLSTANFPVPELAAFDELATKDRFMALSRRLAIPHPQGQVYASKAELIEALARGELRLPAMLKPVDRAGSIGVVKIDAANAQTVAWQIDYAPVLAQDFIEGEDRSISIFCRDGAVLKRAIYEHPEGEFRFRKEPALEKLVGEIARELKLTGVFNFDARIDRQGRVWMIECNPRFFFNMDVAMVAGMNFAEPDNCGDGAARLDDRDVRVPQALLRALLRLRRPLSGDWKMLMHWLADPLMFALLAAGYYRRWNAPWLEAFAAARKAREATEEPINRLREPQFESPSLRLSG